MHIKQLSIGQRLGVSFALVAALLLTVAAAGYSQIVDLGAGIALTNQQLYPKIRLAQSIKDDLNETARSMRNVLLMSDAKQIEGEYARIDENRRSISAALDQLDKTVTSDKGRALMQELAGVRASFLAARTDFLNLSKAGDKAGAQEQLLGTVRPLQLQYFDKLEQLIAWQTKLMDQAAKDADGGIASARLLIMGLTAAAMVLCIAVTFFATRSITVPLNQAVAIARKVADGDLTSDIVVSAKDETGQLMLALKEMNAGLVKIVSQVRTGTETMASASTQIASGNLDLSSRTEQQASSLEETASSMEEMTSTVKQNGENARQANTLAASASQVALEGGRVVADVVETMDAINDASKKIVDIISVIDGIAFQTNILALNAAVEAARAGEQGRGFAVVAAEVRNLAQRSAAAAKEIKVLIGDSVDKVEAGSRLVGQAGGTMEQIVSSVQRVTDIMAEITSASREQEAGIEQINQAITEMDTVTQQNAALVEEAAAAAEALQDQAAGLAAVVSAFKIDTATNTSVPIAAARTKAAVVPMARQKKEPARAQRLSAPRQTASAAADADWEEF